MAERLAEFDPQKREAQVRRAILQIARLHARQYEDSWVPATNFLAAADHQGVRVRDEGECLDQIGFLASMSLLDEWSTVSLGARRPTFRERRFRLTTKGRRLLAEEIEPIPGIDDARFGE